MLQNLHFNCGLVLKLLLVSNHFQGNKGFALVVESFEGLAEGTFAKNANELKSE